MAADSKNEVLKKPELPDVQTLERVVKKHHERREYLRILRSTVASLLVVAAAAVIISMLFLPVLRVTGTSMTPTLHDDELVVCRKRGSFQKGDIVAFYYNNKILLKRVIATAGDVVDIKEDGTVIVNGKTLNEPYVDGKALGECDIELPYQVPDERIFVMGDHRSTSVDSRTKRIGCIAEEAVLAGAEEVIRKADIQFGRLDWEFESGERAIDVDEAVLRPVTDPFTGKKRAEMPKLNERLFRGVNVSAGTSGDFYHEFSPQLRQADFIAGLEEYKREIEFAVGLSYGDISNPQTVDKTATEIKSSKQRKFDTVTAIQNNLRVCLEDLCYSLAFYNGLTQSGYELSVNFEDSILADDETKRASDRQDVSMGIMPLWEYRMKWYGEDEETAKKMTSDSTAEVIE